jgi:polyhydroxyalkanoate synthesis regulator phasin
MAKNIKQTKEKVSQVLLQAIEAMSTIREKIPTADVRKRLTNDKIVEGLAKIGLATQGEVNELKAEVRDLESRLEKLEAQLAANGAAASAGPAARRAERASSARA